VGCSAASSPGKGTIRFPAAQAIPLDLVRRVVEVRVPEVQSG
jgi:hypothetical protein